MYKLFITILCIVFSHAAYADDANSPQSSFRFKNGGKEIYEKVYIPSNGEETIRVYDPGKDHLGANNAEKVISGKTGKVAKGKSRWKYPPKKPIIVILRDADHDIKVVDDYNSGGAATGATYEKKWVKCEISRGYKENSHNFMGYSKKTSARACFAFRIFMKPNPFICEPFAKDAGDFGPESSGRWLGSSPLCGKPGIVCGDPCPAKAAVLNGATQMRFEPYTRIFQVIEWGNKPESEKTDDDKNMVTQIDLSNGKITYFPKK